MFIKLNMLICLVINFVFLYLKFDLNQIFFIFGCTNLIKNQWILCILNLITNFLDNFSKKLFYTNTIIIN